MSFHDKIKFGIIALCVVSAILVALHFGHVSLKPAIFDPLPGPGSPK